jgi:hypothetical protein
MKIKGLFGIDGVELGIHVLVTAVLMSFIFSFNRDNEALAFGVVTLVGSLLLLSFRRSRALRRREPEGLTTGDMAAERLVELEDRVAELEERLDFAERLIARQSENQLLPPGNLR